MSKVFLVGAGLIGQHILDLLLADPTAYSISALTRRSEQAAALQKLNVTPVSGELHDADLLTKHAASSDIVFHCATADDLPSAEAILAGVRQRAAAGKSTIYIHTSGTSVMDDDAQGQYKSETIYADNKPEMIDALPDDAPHRPIDLAIVRTARELGEKAKIAIMIPPLIYGYNARHGRLTIQIPTVTRFALKHGYSGYVGKGLAVESSIHVADLARGYVTLLHWMEKQPASEVVKNPYWFCENGTEFSWKEVGEEVGKALHKSGKISEPTAKEFPKDTYDDLFGDLTGALIGLNSRSRAVRLRELGWKPQEKGIWESYREDELPALLEKESS